MSLDIFKLSQGEFIAVEYLENIFLPNNLTQIFIVRIPGIAQPIYRYETFRQPTSPLWNSESSLKKKSRDWTRQLLMSI